MPEIPGDVRDLPMITRRAFTGGALALCACTGAHANQGGCWLTSLQLQAKRIHSVYSYDGGVPAIIHGSGVPLLDQAMAVALSRMSKDFDALPGLVALSRADVQ